ncbi:unnamed protein product [Cylicostephanus goldi]|uniref:Uncharacterized protein n=1 Tax=Cylicostephanus goldi TaxID=71465 RepID=A0A3P6QYC1_CYLGO|nr:unnamed protein product [Cylicostephanus goldi]
MNRACSISYELIYCLQMYHRLFDAGKKRAALSPSADLQNAMDLSSYLERAGRK